MIVGMDATQITDLKEFFVATLADTIAPINARLDKLEQGLADLRQEMYVGFDSIRGEIADLRTEMHEEIAVLRQEMYDGFAGVGEAIDYIHTESDKRDLLITKLNKKWRKG